jgi:hypothetical protein
MPKYEVLENCHYRGITYRKGQTADLPADPKWPDRFRRIAEAGGATIDNEEAAKLEAEEKARAEAKAKTQK